MTLLGHSPGGRRAWPPGLCPGATVATVESGVPLMRPKWVRRTWAHQGDAQGQGTRLADGPPHLPHGVRTNTASTTKAKDRGTPRGPPQSGSRHGGPGDPGAWQEARLTPGNQPPERDEDKLASPGWKLVEDLGAKKMEAPREAGMKKLSVPICPPWKRWEASPTPSEKNTWMRGGHVAS